MASTLPGPSLGECCPPECTEVASIQVPGPRGIEGEDGTDGTDGTNVFTTFTAAFTIPAELATGVATVADTSWMVIGQILYGSRVDGSIHAFFEVAAIGGATSVTLQNLEDAATFMYLENSAPASTLTIGSMLIPAGIQGPSGTLTGAIPAGSQLEGNYGGAGPQLEIPKVLGAIIAGNGSAAVEVTPGTNGHMIAYDSTDATDGLKIFKALPLLADTGSADNRIARLDRPLGTEVPVPLQPSLVTITDAGAIRADGSGGNARGTDAVDLQLTRGGVTQVASGTQSFIGGGQNNTAATTGSVVVGGDGNAVTTNNRGAIVGGLSNTASGLESFIGGGNSNLASNDQAAICGGDDNTASGLESFIGGGNSNVASNDRSSVCGGNDNTSSSQDSFIGGGTTNQASGAQSCVAGGDTNIASNQACSILGGHDNIASGGPGASVSGGGENTSSGPYSSVPGGVQALADKWGQHSVSSGQFASRGDAQVSGFMLRIATTDATPTVLLLDGATAGRVMVVPNNTSWIFRMMLVARRSTGTTSIYEAIGQIENTAGTVTATAVAVTEVNDGIGLPATPVAITADAVNDALTITVTGVAANNIRWVAHVRVVECGF